MRNKPTHQKRRPRKHPNWLIVIQVLKSVLKAILQSFCQEFSLSQTWKNAAAPVKPIPGTSHRPIRLSKAHLELLRSHQRPVPDPCATRRSTNKSSATILCLVLNVYIYIYWLVVDLPLWKNMNVSWDDDIPNIWEKNIPNHQPVEVIISRICWTHTGSIQWPFPGT